MKIRKGTLSKLNGTVGCELRFNLTTWEIFASLDTEEDWECGTDFNSLCINRLVLGGQHGGVPWTKKTLMDYCKQMLNVGLKE